MDGVGNGVLWGDLMAIGEEKGSLLELGVALCIYPWGLSLLCVVGDFISLLCIFSCFFLHDF